MLLETNRFKFAGFVLEKKEKILLRDEKPVSITPKAFQLLLVLVENHGRLVEKDELMKAVWEDSFVEEGNLSYTMLLLRKILGDDKSNPRFIETVPKRGYRFIAEVETVSSEDNYSIKKIETINESEKRSLFGSRGFIYSVTPVLLICIVISLAFWYLKSSKNITQIPVLSANFSSEKLSTSGKVFLAIVMPDGMNVVYSTIDGNNKESIWIRHLDSSNNIQIIPPSNEIYGGLAPSSDGNFIYFSRRLKYSEISFDIYRASIFGGIPTKVVSSTQGWFSLSPDNTKISFVRCPQQSEENCSLWIADSFDGQNEQKLVSYPSPLRIGDNSFSPDGKSIAFAFGQSNNRANEFNLSEIDLESGEKRLLTSEKFFNIKRLAWLPDKNGLLITASKQPAKLFRIWHISTATSEAKSLTKDSENYSYLSLDKEGKTLISTQVKEDKNLFLLNLNNPSALQNLSNASKASFVSEKKLVFHSLRSGNYEIWSINSDGSDLRQLTNNNAEDAEPIASSNGNQIFFVSNRTGEAQVWRMNSDGSDQQQITFKEGGTPFFITPDQKWVYYSHGIERSLWRASSNGGDEQLVFNRVLESPSISPDASKLAFIEKNNQERTINIISLDNLETIKTISSKEGNITSEGLNWLPDGKSLAYLIKDAAGRNIIKIHQLSKQDSQQIFETNEDIYSISFGVDGKNIAIVKGGWKHDVVKLSGLF